MIPPSPYDNHAAIRGAIWLYIHFLCYCPALDARWRPVADGVALTDEQIAINLNVSARTVSRWRRKLENLGYLRSKLVSPRRRRFWLVNLAMSDDEAGASVVN